jgi:hypothetical protein
MDNAKCDKACHRHGQQRQHELIADWDSHALSPFFRNRKRVAWIDKWCRFQQHLPTAVLPTKQDDQQKHGNRQAGRCSRDRSAGSQRLSSGHRLRR